MNQEIVKATEHPWRDPKQLHMTSQQMWDKIAQQTDELLEVAESFQNAFKKAIEAAAGPELAKCILFAGLKDPVRIFEKGVCMGCTHVHSLRP